ncbi:homeodomain protein nk2.1 [Plakobranchus ocellatus]|uniref:Homeodomain protein nk2.1 n=1 Tax=Plakobranchus ocellatus TaxID=259542 RepID=A0AAV4E3F5_9GAST|nr:homeodomain protein nk2.1 [Plakobranchus ocellatus]
MSLSPTRPPSHLPPPASSTSGYHHPLYHHAHSLHYAHHQHPSPSSSSSPPLPGHAHSSTTPFSVSDILHPPLLTSSALDPDFKKTVEASIPPLGGATAGGLPTHPGGPSPYQHTHRSPQHQLSSSSSAAAAAAMGSMTMGGMHGVPVTNPYANYVPQFSHHTSSFPAQYCNGGDLYGADPSRHGTAGWYGGAADSRFSCE